MKNYLTNKEIVVKFEMGLKNLIDANPKENGEKIEKLSSIAIQHEYLSNEFAQIIFKKIETVYFNFLRRKMKFC